MMIESKRLFMYPASDDAMKRLIDEAQDENLKSAYSEMLEGCINDPANRIWHAVWFIELKEQTGVIVGEFSFKGLNDDGMVELGYGLREGYCGKGYMTEAVKCVSVWALEQAGVARIEAEADPDNTASQNVLLNAGFTAAGETGAEGLRYVYK